MIVPLPQGLFCRINLFQGIEGGTADIPHRLSLGSEIHIGGAEMKNDNRVKITLVCSECKQRNYDTKKNKRNDPDRLEMNKHCPFCHKHTLHKESK